MTAKEMKEKIAKATAEAYVKCQNSIGTSEVLESSANSAWYALDKLCEDLGIEYIGYYDFRRAESGGFEYYMKEVE